MKLPSKQALADGAERVFWTAAAAAVSAGLVVIADWDPIMVAVITPVLTTLKVLVATKIGDPDTAAIRVRHKG
jgi:cobalamin biosynthesis protein CbiD